MKKVALHWQILIALILAVIYGLLFPTHYVLDEQVVDKLEKKMAPSEVVATLREAQSDSSYTYGELVEVAREQLTPAAYEKYYPLLVRFSYTNPAIKAVSWMGDLFLRALRMIIIPLILSSLISGVTNIGSGSNLGRLSLKTMGYYVDRKSVV